MERERLELKAQRADSTSYPRLQTLAEAIAEASKATGAQVDLFQFPEILSDEVLAKMHAAVSCRLSSTLRRPLILCTLDSPRPTTPSSSPMT